MDKMEIWKDIKGYDGYQISSIGRVKRLPYTQVRKLKQGDVVCKFKGGLLSIQNSERYNQVTICGVTQTIHKMMMEAFIGPRPEGYVIDHIDNNPLNNKLENLTYTTYIINNTKDRHFNNTHRGIHYCKSKKKYISRISIDGKRIHLGAFENEYDASIAQEKYKLTYDYNF